ncbi:MAG: hypothetical protein PHR91_03185 [Candidatus Omnitrophica bacterium]|nr:hypothetical protein [Candidatus Omnitrophota bacterium]
MVRGIFLFSTVLFAVVCFALPAQAQVTGKDRLIHADKNRDGVVDQKEMNKEKQRERMQKADTNCDGVLSSSEKVKACSKVNTVAEKKYDANGDGWLDASEGSEYLKDKYTVIKTEGKAKVDSSLEAKYDTNKDGVIDSNEAQALKKDLEG